ncbi:MAG TPA: DUF3455 domain-containing protein [Terriglobales bacterium]|nr:DUF3455 domain-containing protein [Terriglobales bacterium]
MLKLKFTPRTGCAIQGAIATALVLASAVFGAVPANAQSLTAPQTPATITPPAGNVLYALGAAVGTQGYVCLPTSTGASWTVNASRPEATLFVKILGRNVQVMTHFLSPDTSPNENAPNPLPFGSPTWQSSFDSSMVWAKALASIPAGSDPSCSNAGSIPCLLLQSIGSQQGPSGGGLMTPTTYVQRLNTTGGVAPSEGCSTATDVGKQKLVPYTADYYFFRAR